MGISSMLGVALGVTALITVISVMNGYETELRQRILGVVSHVTLFGTQGGLHEWSDRRVQISGLDEVNGVAPFIELQGMLSANGRNSAVMARGVEPNLESEVSDFP
ncbi:MAG TPA: lipoprotein-releasing system transmembrane subunit LolC, partial [Gammaproteobacteria bacterium]|nr:lipoprotein-releasing system transmembrane subunit LolC [Gammaproteobacteria bacterium]